MLKLSGMTLVASLLLGTAVKAETSIVFRYNDGDVAVIEAAVEEFEAANPDIDVTVERIAWGDARTQFLREALIGGGPDVVHIAFVWPLEMGQAVALQPLNDLISENGIQSGIDDFVAQDLFTSKEGSIFAVPWTTDTFTLVYNKDLLSEAGISEFPSEWPALAEASRKIHEATGKAGFGFSAGSAASNVIWFMLNYYWWSNGHALIVDDGAGGYKMGITPEEVAEGFEYFASFMGDGGNPDTNISVSSWSDPSIVNGMISGHQAIAFMPPATFRSMLDTYRSQTGSEETPFASATIPAGSAGGISHLGGRSLGINSNTKHPEESFRLVQYLTSKGFFEKHLKTQMPAQKALLSSVDFGPEMAGFATQLANGRSWGAYANPKTPIGEMWNETGRSFGSFLIGQISAEVAAQDFYDKISGMLGK
ncbi:MAG: extracellular solute-binding protein [Roseibium sp.]|uniref:ABC transporter substrate-binding protein n=1 Tax=Roseibium sp. TaxID=1936156 RepID=UPI0026095514|nr:extracellular solute-binding protein [Roseibium sp.]MCV0424153.1 extracellular solute-binding protein [Roseibium sp.]